MTRDLSGQTHDCRQIEALLPPFVDGLAPPATRTAVAAHLDRCDDCRRAAEAQRAIRAMLVTRRRGLADAAPADLADDVQRAIARAEHGPEDAGVDAPARPSWSRLSALAAAAAVVIAITGTFTWATGRSAVLLAAQLTLDHLKCFVLDGQDDLHDVVSADATAQFTRDYGMDVRLPSATSAGGRARLVGLRRCLYGEGWIAHALYRVDHQAVSMFVIPSGGVSPADVQAFGRRAEVVVRDDVTYVLVAPPGLLEVAVAVGLEAE